MASNDVTPAKQKRDTPEEMIFGNCSAVFICAADKLSCQRSDFVRATFQHRGGWSSKQAWETTTHIVANSWAQVMGHHWQCARCPFRLQSTIPCVSYDWIAACIFADKLVPEHYFRLDQENDVGLQRNKWMADTGDVNEHGKWIYDDDKANKSYGSKL